MASLLQFRRTHTGERAYFGQAAKNFAISLQETGKKRSRPIARHIADHAYTWLGFGCISAASFVHSVFTGLIVTGILFLVFEFKVSE